MAIRNRMPEGASDEYRRLRRKADQHWDMAGLARQDNDRADEKRHAELARDYDRQAREVL